MKSLENFDLTYLLRNLSWSLKNICLEPDKLRQINESYFQNILQIMNQIMTQHLSLETCPDRIIEDFGSIILELLKSFDDTQHFDYLLENFDVREFVERCLCRVQTGTEDLVNFNIRNGVTIFG